MVISSWAEWHVQSNVIGESIRLSIILAPLFHQLILGHKWRNLRSMQFPAQAAAFWRSGADIEALLSFMRGKGLGQGRSVEALQMATAIDGIRARIAVIYGETWRDQREPNVQTSEQLIEALTYLAQESGGPTRLLKWRYRELTLPPLGRQNAPLRPLPDPPGTGRQQEP